MARLVPAKPKVAADDLAIITKRLESELDDDFVVFQPRPEYPRDYVIAHPDGGVLHLWIGSENAQWDPDAEEWEDEGTTPAATNQLPLPDKKHHYVAAVPNPDNTTGALSSQDPNLCRAVVRLLTGDKISEDDITAAIQSVSSGATGYRRGSVPSAQTRWRQKEGRTAGTGLSFKLNENNDSDESEPTATPSSTVTPATAPEHMDPQLLTMIESCIEVSCGDREVLCAGVIVSREMVVSPTDLLPAILLSANELWLPIAAKRGGGFHFKLKRDKDALLGYRVSAIDPASVYLMFLPITRVLTSSEKFGNDGIPEIVLDGAVKSFAHWLRVHGFDDEDADQYTFRVIERTLLQ